MAKATTDHQQIRRWAEGHGGKPAVVKGTGDDGPGLGILRITFPDAPNSDTGAMDSISWDDFFEQFEASKLALLYDDDSRFNKIVGRDTVDRREHGDHDASRHDRR
ncbi:hypothetical protein [Azospirillum halopraeferens]|uniref:hypothetical protein n=1 Tax=Azospirillum halopraeferens TaxID=34010 RepID=UPI0003F7C24B|nr:hypothetical protein [Azospirillum halopraeferens]